MPWVKEDLLALATSKSYIVYWVILLICLNMAQVLILMVGYGETGGKLSIGEKVGLLLGVAFGVLVILSYGVLIVGIVRENLKILWLWIGVATFFLVAIIVSGVAYIMVFSSHINTPNKSKTKKPRKPVIVGATTTTTTTPKPTQPPTKATPKPKPPCKKQCQKRKAAEAAAATRKTLMTVAILLYICILFGHCFLMLIVWLFIRQREIMLLAYKRAPDNPRTGWKGWKKRKEDDLTKVVM
jgi:flagellar basal body-associated protein FliL